MVDLDFYKNKKVFISGHTGFKGTWLCKILLNAGAIITGYSLDAPTNPSLFDLLGLVNKITSIKGDIRNKDTLEQAFMTAKPDIVFHLAAQPIVLEGYNDPVYTYETNVIGTVNMLECARKCDSVKSFVNITTDKVYQESKNHKPYVEDDVLNGYDPYANSKSCSELVTSSYIKSFFNDHNVRISTMRAGNVIGGGDFAKNRIIPDCVRSAIGKQDIIVRNQNSIRPYQHVLEPLFAYLLVAQKQFEDDKYMGSYNVGPKIEDCITTGELATVFCRCWGEDLKWKTIDINNKKHEASFLQLDCSKIKNVFGWEPCWNIEKAIEKTVEFSKKKKKNGDLNKCIDDQINEYLNDLKVKG